MRGGEEDANADRGAGELAVLLNLAFGSEFRAERSKGVRLLSN